MKEEQEFKNRMTKIEKIKMILPILWSSYEHMFEVRRTATQNNINFLLIIVSFLPVICLTLYIYLKSSLFLIPAAFQIIALLILLKSFFIKGWMIPWLKLKETLKELDDDTFESDLFAALKAFENDTGIYLEIVKPIINRALFLLISSIFLIVLAFLFMFLNGSILLYIVTILLLIVFVLLCFFYKEMPTFNFTNEYTNCKNDIERWLKDEKE